MMSAFLHGDCREVLHDLAFDSVQLTVTSPPYYNARDYSQFKDYEAYLEFLREVFGLVFARTEPGRFLVVNISPVIQARAHRQDESVRYPIPYDLHGILKANGWQYQDDIVWVKPGPSVPNRVAGFQTNRRPLAYKPNVVTESIMVYRKPSGKLLDANIRAYSEEIRQASLVHGDIARSNVWEIAPVADKVHSAVFPLELVRRVVAYYSYVGDLVVDPFGGVATTGVACKMAGRQYFLVEQSKKYHAEGSRRLKAARTNLAMRRFVG